MRYGLSNGTKKTQREIAQMLGISRSYVSIYNVIKTLHLLACHPERSEGSIQEDSSLRSERQSRILRASPSE
ncbi:MAG: sigma factor-like helix-turn-helix DNA-binding protein [Firmicutes bacterium]|nr:sigma factor-like helix-turn-helix DNA-binding protein [Bacillota bacterium]MDD3298641.1 sigma factor-like helix-turn-helix DNA-binding protein [Bacillota bacterium]